MIRRVGMSYDPDIELTILGSKNGKLLFYPSSGYDCRWLFDYDYDVFVMADYWPRTKDQRHRFWHFFKRNMGSEVSLVASTVRTRVFRFRNKWGFIFFQDNNEVLERIRRSGNKISCFIGVCDGCREGGNYECVNDVTFLDKVMSFIHPDGMTYITDHSNYLFPMIHYRYYGPEPYQEFIFGDKLFRRVSFEGQHSVKSDYRWIEKCCAAYTVSVYQPTVYEWTSSDFRVTIEHDSIANHIKELSGALISRRCEYLCEHTAPSIDIEIAPHYYFKPSKLSGWRSGDSLNHLLKICEQRKWEIVGTTAFGEGDHSEMISIFENWNGDFPKWIRIFHLDLQDFASLKKQFCKQVQATV